MSLPTAAERPGALSLRRRALARCATAVAWGLVRLPPRRLARVLRLLSAGARPATAAEALAARRAVVSVSVRCAGLGCLQRSVATVLVCRAGGAWPDWCAGFRTGPFRAHAWVEVAGRPVGEGPDVALYCTVLRVGCRAVPVGGAGTGAGGGS